MDLLGLPSNVQRRIALLLEQKPDQAPAGTTISGSSVPDHASVGTSVPNDQGAKFAEPSTSWKLSLSSENVASQLRQTTANAVYTRAFGDHALQARHISQLVQSVVACLSSFCEHATLHFSVQGLTQGCRAEAEKVLQQATRAGLGGSKPLQAWKDSQVSQVTPEACDLHSNLCMILHMLYMPLHALNIAQYVC